VATKKEIDIEIFVNALMVSKLFTIVACIGVQQIDKKLKQMNGCIADQFEIPSGNAGVCGANRQFFCPPKCFNRIPHGSSEPCFEVKSSSDIRH
jgi:hypothetical protein